MKGSKIFSRRTWVTIFDVLQNSLRLSILTFLLISKNQMKQRNKICHMTYKQYFSLFMPLFACLLVLLLLLFVYINRQWEVFLEYCIAPWHKIKNMYYWSWNTAVKYRLISFVIAGSLLLHHHQVSVSVSFSLSSSFVLCNIKVDFYLMGTHTHSHILLTYTNSNIHCQTYHKLTTHTYTHAPKATTTTITTTKHAHTFVHAHRDPSPPL